MVMAQTSSKGKVVSRDKKPNYNQLPLEEREKLLKPYLPLPRDRTRSQDRQATHSKHAPSSAVQSLFSLSFNDLLKLLIHKLLFHLIQLVFSIYIRIRQTYHAVRELIFSVLYYHNRTPEFIQKDVKGLSRLPRHLSVIVDLRAQGSKEAVQRLMHDVAELAAWCACAGIEMLSVYEKTGVLKSQIPELHHTTLTTFSSYFPRPQRPSLHIRAPNRSTYSPSPSPSRSPSPTPSPYDGASASSERQKQHLNILLMSAHDGRDTLVDLTKTLSEMSQKRKIAPSEVTTELIHAEVEDATACKEPDLLVVMGEPVESGLSGRRFKRNKRKQKSLGAGTELSRVSQMWSGDGICLRGYPPWQVRLTEIFCVQDSAGIGYQIFLRALHRYAKAEMRFGR